MNSVEKMTVNELLQAILSEQEPNIHSIQSADLSNEIVKWNPSELIHFLQSLQLYSKHQKLILSMHSWDIYDHLYTLYQNSQIQDEILLLNQGITEIFWLIPIRELEIMVLEKFALSHTIREFEFLLHSIQASFQLITPRLNSAQTGPVISMDYLIKVLVSLLKKYNELMMTESLNNSEKSQVLNGLILTASHIVDDYSMSVSTRFSNKVKSIITGFLLQIIMKGVVTIQHHDERKQVLHIIAKLMIVGIWENDYNLIFLHIHRQRQRIITELKKQRKQEKFYKLWSTTSPAVSQSELSVLKSVDERLLSAISDYLSTINYTTEEDLNPEIPLTDELIQEIDQSAGEFIYFNDVLHNNEVLVISTQFPWLLSGLSLIIFTIINDSLIYSLPTDFSVKPFRNHYLQTILQTILPYLIEIPMIQSNEGLIAFNLLYCLSPHREGFIQQHFLPSWVTLQLSSSSSSSNQTNQKEKKELLFAFIDDEISLTYDPTGVKRMEYFTSVPSRLFLKTIAQSQYHWKFAQILITSIVVCPVPVLREKSFQTFRQYIFTFESKSKLLLLGNLVDHCPYSQVKALLIDLIKFICQQSITGLLSAYKENAITQPFSLDISSLQSPKFMIDFPVLATTTLKNEEEHHQFIQSIVENPQIWQFETDYLTIMNKQLSKDEIEALIYQYSSHRPPLLPLQLTANDSLFWSETLIKRFLYSSQDDITKLTFEKILEYAEYFNGKMNLLLFILIKLELSLREYLFMRKYQTVKRQEEKDRSTLQFVIVWGYFFLPVAEKGKSILAQEEAKEMAFIDLKEVLLGSVQFIQEVMIYLFFWEKELKKLFHENNSNYYNNNTNLNTNSLSSSEQLAASLPAEELIKIDLLLSVVHRCNEKLRQLYTQLYLLFSSC